MKNNYELFNYFLGDRSHMSMASIKRCEEFMRPIIKRQQKNTLTKEQALRGVKNESKWIWLELFQHL